jgi:hypothetical protein
VPRGWLAGRAGHGRPAEKENRRDGQPVRQARWSRAQIGDAHDPALAILRRHVPTTRARARGPRLLGDLERRAGVAPDDGLNYRAVVDAVTEFSIL